MKRCPVLISAAVRFYKYCPLICILITLFIKTYTNRVQPYLSSDAARTAIKYKIWYPADTKQEVLEELISWCVGADATPPLHINSQDADCEIPR